MTCLIRLAASASSIPLTSATRRTPSPAPQLQTQVPRPSLLSKGKRGGAVLLDRARAAPLRVFNQTRFNAQMGKHVLPIDSRKINFALHRFLPYSGVEKPPVNACPWDQRTHGQALSGLNCKS